MFFFNNDNVNSSSVTIHFCSVCNCLRSVLHLWIFAYHSIFLSLYVA